MSLTDDYTVYQLYMKQEGIHVATFETKVTVSPLFEACASTLVVPTPLP